ncbi:MAG: hypothetical protein CL504_01345, partial [Actinobacteria bacterium]|nr:hypothetical protein [Actinomycetota bacterium]
SVDRDISAANGILHVTDKVLIPDSYLTTVSALQKRYDHTTLVAAVVAAELTTTLSGTGPFTIFAPTNAAFSATTGAVKAIVDKVAASTTLSDSEKTTLQNLIKYHGLSSEVKAASVPSASSETLYAGNNITTTSADSGSVTVKGSSNSAAIAVSEADVDVSNGVIHVIGSVLAF